MLSTVYAAEVQFRHDSEGRERELAILRSIRDRREALAVPQRARNATLRTATWPRPIGVRVDVADCTEACAVA